MPTIMERLITELVHFFQLSKIIEASTSGSWANLDGFDWAVVLLAPIETLMDSIGR